MLCRGTLHCSPLPWNGKEYSLMKKYSVKKLALAGMFCALCVVGSVFSFPMFGSKCAPVQHMVNVLCAVLLGPWWGVGVAFVASLLRNLLGLGSLMAFPGSMFGALLCGLVYHKTKNILATVVGEVFCSGILGLLNTDASIFTDSYTYLQIYTFGVIFVLLYNAATGAFNAMGDSRTPLILLIFSSVINVVLDIVFTLDACGVRLGVAGLAWATFVAQGAACVAALIWMALRLSRIREDSERDEDALAAIRNSTAPHAHHRLHLPHPTFKLFSARQLRSILPIALPSVVQQIFVPLGLLFGQSKVNGFASPVIAGYTSAVKVNTLCVSCNTMFSNAVSAYSAQNRGAGKEDRVVRGLKASVVVAIIIAAVFTALSFFCSEQLIDLFASYRRPA